MCEIKNTGDLLLKYERGRVQTDDEYKYLFYLYTIECETIKNHMHRAGSHEIQIPTFCLIPPGSLPAWTYPRRTSLECHHQLVNHRSVMHRTKLT